jgi:hypothetical protein
MDDKKSKTKCNSENLVWQKPYLKIFLNDTSESMNNTYIVIYWQEMFGDHDVETKQQSYGGLKHAAVHSKFAQ